MAFESFAFGLITGTKQFSHELRPDGSGYHSFPSGHTATAFAAAEWLRIEYRQTSPWIGVAGDCRGFNWVSCGFITTATGGRM